MKKSEPTAKAVEAFWDTHRTAVREALDRQAQTLGPPDLNLALGAGAARPRVHVPLHPFLLIPGIAAALALVLYSPMLFRAASPKVSQTMVADQIFLSTDNRVGTEADPGSAQPALLYSPVLRIIDKGISRWDNPPPSQWE